jgi:5-methylcytosine-specific restriction endonuclease McrA
MATRKASAKLGAMQKRISRAQVIERSGGICHICKGRVPSDEIHIDHIIPLALGGSHTADNLAVAHARCNMRKGARFLTLV